MTLLFNRLGLIPQLDHHIHGLVLLFGTDLGFHVDEVNLSLGLFVDLPLLIEHLQLNILLPSPQGQLLFGQFTLLYYESVLTLSNSFEILLELKSKRLILSLNV